LLALGWLLVIGSAVASGYWLGRQESAAAVSGLETLRNDVASLSEEVARGRAERVRLERAHQMDREAKRQAQQVLAELQQERLLLIRRVSYLQRLVHEGRKGIVEVKDLQVTPTDVPGRYAFQLVFSQLVPENGRTQGRARISVVVSVDGRETSLALDALAGSSPASIALDFEHFQAVSGVIELGDGHEPRRLLVDVEPEGESMAASSEIFLWPIGNQTALIPCPIPEDGASLPGQAELE
jgi:hypothetical protein